jgi:hypothetical protein
LTFQPMDDKIGEGKIPLIVGGSLAKSEQPAAVGRRGSGLGITPVDSDPNLRRRVVRGSPW